MVDSDPIDELLLQWEEARRQGIQLSPETLCAACPRLRDEVRRRLHAILTMEQVLGVSDPEATHRESSPHPADGLEFTGRGRLPQVPGYEIIAVIDQGGMGVVYKAKQLDLGRTVAVKMMSGVQLSPKMIARFRTETEAAARLQHPHIVQVFEVGQAEGRPFFSMEYVDGGSLAQQLARQRPTPRLAAELVETLARAVQAAHERGIVHRDLKPSNVLLTREGSPKIADFGLAKRLDAEAGHTHSGEVLGTPSYMAPEQADGKKALIGPRTDVYALGGLLYEMLTGQPPFKGSTVLEAMRLVTTREPPAPSRLDPTVPRDLEAICLMCLEKSPAHRYATAHELAEDLRRFLQGQPVKARPVGPLRRAGKWVRRHPQGTALAGLLVLLALVPAVFAMRSYRAQQAIRLRAVQVAPQVGEILRRNCYECHGEDPTTIEKDLNILDHALLLDGKRRIVVPGSPADSRLIRRIDDGSMPPEELETRLPRVTETELALLKDWILGGAPPLPPEDPRHPIPPVVPPSALAGRVKTIFEEHCYECHKYDVAKGGIKILHHRLLVTTRKVVVPGRPGESELFHLIDSSDEKMRMPPAPAERLKPEEIETVRQWILEGAPGFPKSE